MPYITQNRRIILSDGVPPSTSGELNYLFTSFMLDYLRVEGMSYAHFNDLSGAVQGFLAGDFEDPLVRELVEISATYSSSEHRTQRRDIRGALTEALAETRRRVLVPYEEQKREENGDVYNV